MTVVAIGSSPVLSVDKSDFLVNDDGTTSEQNYPRIAVASDRRFVICWVDNRSGSKDIYLQRYHPEGDPEGRNIRVNDDNSDVYQSEPAIAADLSGLYSIVWKDYRNGTYPFDPDIFFQRFDTSLNPVGLNRNMTTEWPDSLKETPDIALSPWGSGVIVWADYRNRDWDVFGQLISANGSLIGSNFKVNSDPGTAQQHFPRVAVSPEGWFVVTWYDNRLGNDDIFAQRFDSLGNALGVNLKVNSDAGDSRQAFSDVATDGAGHFTVVWVDWRNGNYPANPDIYARKFDTSLVAVTSDTKINRDGTTRAQRQPAIAADRRGNVAIIWSDSTGSSWDIVGQMVDITGVVREANFLANSEGDSAQLLPDVALDGRNRYVTWADKRHGNFDIYASIAEYNDPMLVPSRMSLKFEMAVGDPVPSPQNLAIDHAGYNPLRFEVTSSDPWLSAAPSSGVTPDTIVVSISTDTLPHGTYIGSLTLVDSDNNDSSVVVSVRLDVAAPILQLSDDSLLFKAFAGINAVVAGSLYVTNEGPGELVWQITEAAGWLYSSPDTGTGNAVVELQATAVNLEAGVYAEPVIVDAGGAVNSPDTVWAVLEVTDNLPYIRVEPARIDVATTCPAEVSKQVVVSNGGVGILNWMAQTSAGWLVPDPVSGLGEDTIRLSIDTTGLPHGFHSAEIEIVDSNAFNTSERVQFTLDYLLSSNDSIIIGSTQAEPLGSGQLPIDLALLSSVTTISLPLQIDLSQIGIDSIVLAPEVSGLLDLHRQMDSSTEVLRLDFSYASSDSSLKPGQHQLALLYFTAGHTGGSVWVAPPVSDVLIPTLVTADGLRLAPTVLPGEVLISGTTRVESDGRQAIPTSYVLAQNYPNPFNMSTVVEFQLPVRSPLELEVYNILGQKVRLLASGTWPAGDYSIIWDGRFDSGRAAPSGIYFYRLRAGEESLVRKTVLLK